MDINLNQQFLGYYLFERIEDLLGLVEYFNENKKYTLAYALSLVCLFTKEKGQEEYSKDELSILGKEDKYIYKYERYIVHAETAYNMQKYEEANDCLKMGLEYLTPETVVYDKEIVRCRSLFEAIAKKLSEN